MEVEIEGGTEALGRRQRRGNGGRDWQERQEVGEGRCGDVERKRRRVTQSNYCKNYPELCARSSVIHRGSKQPHSSTCAIYMSLQGSQGKKLSILSHGLLLFIPAMNNVVLFFRVVFHTCEKGGRWPAATQVCMMHGNRSFTFIQQRFIFCFAKG